MWDCVVAQHKLAVADFRFHADVLLGAKITGTKWWKFKGEAHKTFKESMVVKVKGHKEGDVDTMWVKMATCVGR
jgi:hypothetical protein